MSDMLPMLTRAHQKRCTRILVCMGYKMTGVKCSSEDKTAREQNIINSIERLVTKSLINLQSNQIIDTCE